MDLLDGLRVASLRDLIQPFEHEISIPLINEREHTSLLIIDRQGRKKQLLCEIVLSQLHENTEKDGIIIVFDLDYTWTVNSAEYTRLMSQLTETQKQRLHIHRDISVIGDLVKQLRQIHTSKSKYTLLSVIVDNVSVFRWSTELEGTTKEEYANLSQRLNKLHTELGCSLIVTSWDTNFDTGLYKHYRPSTSDPTSERVKTWTKHHRSFLTSFTHIIHLHSPTDAEHYHRGNDTITQLNHART